MKIRDIPPTENLGGKLIKIPPEADNPYKLDMGYWFSQWGYPDGKAGIWFKKDMNEKQIYPVFLDNLKDCLDWEII